MVKFARVHRDNYSVYGARKVWLALNREGIQVTRCTVERLMAVLGLRGARRGRTVRTTRSDPAAARPADLVRRDFNPPRPDALFRSGRARSTISNIRTTLRRPTDNPGGQPRPGDTVANFLVGDATRTLGR